MIYYPYEKFVSVLLAAAVATTVLMICFVPVVSFGQQSDPGPSSSDRQGDRGPSAELLATSTLERDLTRQFKLTAVDIKRLDPLIKRENMKVVLTFGHYMQTENQDFLSLWNGVRSSRGEFETGLEGDLTSRQKSALRAARSEFELRVLNQWTSDYLTSLADYLELDS